MTPTVSPGIDGSGTQRARCLLAPNPSPMTLDGTNTWLIAEAGAKTAVVVDPGPDDQSHLRRICSAAEQAGLRVTTIVLTHGHLDHSAGARNLAELTGATVRAVDKACRLGSEGLPPGSVVSEGGCELEVIATPGHTSDSVCLYLRADQAVLTGDTVLGRGTTVIADDGSLGDYLGSLDRLRALADSTELRALLPGHGPLLSDPQAVLDFYITHRAERLAEIRAAVAAGDRTRSQIVARVYAEVDRKLWPAAELSVRAQLAYLADHGELPVGMDRTGDAGAAGASTPRPGAGGRGRGES
ncbi:MAG TPA: MBL fold metallo-hydrolase [Streptosporangiaceae bacterium]|nr:MBL fold metallo-hydrolase [Streptosporangiaceae bacterium]